MLFCKRRTKMRIKVQKTSETIFIQVEFPVAVLTPESAAAFGATLQTVATQITTAAANLPKPVDDADIAAGVAAVQSAAASLPTA